MKLDGAIITIEARPLSACVDLAFSICRSYATRIFTLTAFFALPSTLITLILAKYSDFGLASCAALFLCTAPFLGANLVAGMGHRTFGDEFTVSSALRQSRPCCTSARFIFAGTRYSLASCAFFALIAPNLAGAFTFFLLALIPACLMVRIGFLPEITILERLRGAHAATRRGSMLRESYFSLLGRSLAILLFSGIVSVALFSVLDQAIGLAFGYSILFGESTGSMGTVAIREAWDRFYFDPFLIALVHLVLWTIYPIARLAWFFCYVDLRIRSEGWDLELDCRIEAQRLEVKN